MECLLQGWPDDFLVVILAGRWEDVFHPRHLAFLFSPSSVVFPCGGLSPNFPAKNKTIFICVGRLGPIFQIYFL